MAGRRKCMWGLVILAPIMSGCFTQQWARQTDPDKVELWAGRGLIAKATPPVDYQELVTINTEPQGCRIYCQDRFVGISPVTIRNNGGSAEYLLGPGIGFNRKLSWKLKSEGGWNIQAFKEGYPPASRFIPCGDEVFEQAFANVDWQNTPKIVTGERCVLLSLNRGQYPGHANTGDPTTSSSMGNSIPCGGPPTSFVGSSQCAMSPDCSTNGVGKADFEQAISGYEAALTKRNNARLLATGTIASQTIAPDLPPSLQLLGTLGAQYSVDDADKDVEIAQKRLGWLNAQANHGPCQSQ